MVAPLPPSAQPLICYTAVKTDCGDCKPMATETSEPEPRIAIWSLPARVIGVYFIVYLVQYIPSVAFEAYTYQRADGELLARTIIEIIKASGPIGLGCVDISHFYFVIPAKAGIQCC